MLTLFVVGLKIYIIWRADVQQPPLLNTEEINVKIGKGTKFGCVCLWELIADLW